MIQTELTYQFAWRPIKTGVHYISGQYLYTMSVKNGTDSNFCINFDKFKYQSFVIIFWKEYHEDDANY